MSGAIIGKVYIVQGTEGFYPTTWLVCAYRDGREAERHAEEATAIAKRLRERLTAMEASFRGGDTWLNADEGAYEAMETAATAENWCNERDPSRRSWWQHYEEATYDVVEVEVFV